MLFFSLFVTNCIATVNLTIGIDITNKESLSYLGRLEQHYLQFHEKGLNLKILYHILPCYTCKQRHNFTKNEPNCFGGGKYCQFSSYADGQQLLTEIIRQKCLKQEDISIYLSYINIFQQDCLDNPQYTYCQKNILEKNPIFNKTKPKIDQCINASFQGEGDKALVENSILAEEMKQQYNQSILTVYLNDKDITDKEFPEMIINLCQEFKDDRPKYCDIQQLITKYTTTQIKEEINFFLFILFLIILIFISIRMIKKTKQVSSKSASVPIEETIGIIQEDNVQ